MEDVGLVDVKRALHTRVKTSPVKKCRQKVKNEAAAIVGPPR